MGKIRPGDIGFDVIHVNVHKTFATPHGGGGPGAGPVGVKKNLIPFLPSPRVLKDKNGKYFLAQNNPQSIGKVAPFFGNFNVLLKGYAYLLMLGKDGLVDASEKAVLNANYILARLKDYYEPAYDRICMHECVFSASRQLKNGVHALDIAKFLIDKGYHPPTVYFPLIVKEAMMIEPTETESKETLDDFIQVMIEAAKLSQTNPEEILSAPKLAPVSRPDETKAAREVNVNWKE
jgi:glycine dehydrogenase subunit 2